MKTKKPTAFELALAARKGEIPVESISGAAKLLYRDTTIDDARMAEFAAPRTAQKKSGQFSSPQPHVRAKLA
jgi:hypothetical protein